MLKAGTMAFESCDIDRLMDELYEIVMLSNGDVVLQRTDEKDAPLLKISFSDDAKKILGDASLMVAKEMIDAGIDAAQDLSFSVASVYDDNDTKRILH